MVKGQYLSRVISMLVTAVKLVAALVIGSLLSAALVYSFPAAPVFLWAVIILGGWAVCLSILGIVTCLIEGDKSSAIAIILLWVVIWFYLDMMRYFANAWQIELGNLLSVVSFPRYFIIHAKYFFRDLLFVLTGSSSGPVIVLQETDPGPIVPKNSGPLFAITDYVYKFTENVVMNIVSSILFAIMVVIWNGRRT